MRSPGTPPAAGERASEQRPGGLAHEALPFWTLAAHDPRDGQQTSREPQRLESLVQDQPGQEHP